VLRADASRAWEVLDRVDRVAEGWWAAVLRYEAGRVVEPVGAGAPDDTALPDLVLARFDARLVLPSDGPARLEGCGAGRELLAAAAARAAYGDGPAHCVPGLPREIWRSSLDVAGWTDRVRGIQRLLAEGECYQVNLTRRLTAGIPADPVALCTALATDNPAPHAFLLAPGDGTAVVSASPERFLRRDGDRVETRPIKGTDRDPAWLATSAKDAAEHVMIVDLARNDLGRVCRPGTVAVPELMALEAHPGLHHLVSTVRGRLRPGVGFADLVFAAFPPASVTGAPKPRVLQAIADLEPVPRGVYCGAVGWIDAARRRADLAVAIRTFTVLHDRTDLGVGGGIVADSDPLLEWDETVLKAHRLVAAAARGGPARVRRAPAGVGSGP